MSYRLLELPDMQVTDLSFSETQCTLIFADASIIKVMDAAKQRTSWKQSGRIVIKGNFDDDASALKIEFPNKVQSGEFQDNVFSYYGTIRLPCHVYGNVGISMQFEQLPEAIKISGEEMEVILEGDPKYIAHID